MLLIRFLPKSGKEEEIKEFLVNQIVSHDDLIVGYGRNNNILFSMDMLCCGSNYHSYVITYK